MLKELNAISGQLPGHDLEYYSHKIRSMLQKVTDKEKKVRSVDLAHSKRFQFKRKPSLSKVSNNNKNDTKTTLHNPNVLICNQSFMFNGSQHVYENFKECILMVSPNIEFMETYSLFLRHFISSSILFDQVPFKQGSILIEDCEDSIIHLVCKNTSNIQIRLHLLKNCKLYINKEGNATQNIIIENCSNCIFHESTKETIVIRDFNNLGFDTTNTSSYTFQNFSID